MNKKLISLILLVIIGIISPVIPIYATATQITPNVSGTHYYERHTWYSAGRYWVFYSDGTDVLFDSSTDGITWLGHTHFINGNQYTQRCDSVLSSDGTTIHLLAQTAGLVNYRMGTCNTDGTITWSAAFKSFGLAGVTEVSIGLDSQGYPWFAYNDNSEKCLTIYRSSTKNGIFTGGAEGTLLVHGGGVGSDTEGKLLSLPNQDMYIIYTKVNTNGLLYGKKFDYVTKTLGVEETITTTQVHAYGFSLISDGSILYLAWMEDATEHAYVAWRNTSGSWTELGDVSTEVISGTPGTVEDNTYGGVWIVWGGVGDIMHLRHLSPTGVLNTVHESKTITGILGFECVEVSSSSNDMAIVYITATGIYFDILHIYSEFKITNMEGSDTDGDGLKLIVVEEQFYNFQLDITGITTDPVGYASIRFYNNANLIQVDYNATTGLTTIISGNDYILLHETDASTSGDTLSVTWGIWLKSTLLDKQDMDIQTYFEHESGIGVGWDTYTSYCDLYNLGGWVSTTASGAQSSTTTCSTAITTSVTLSSTTYYTTSLTTTPSLVLTTSVTTMVTSSLSSAITTTLTTTTGVSCETISVTTTSPTTRITSTLTTVSTTSTTSRTTSTTVYSTSTTSSTVLTTSATTILKYVGAGGQSAGGDTFDLYVYPNSMAMGKVAFRNLQNVHALVKIQTDAFAGWWAEEQDIIPIEFGMDYWTGLTYVTGWSVKIEEVSAFADSNLATINWKVEWYYAGVLVKTEYLNTFPQTDGVNSPAYTTIVLDMWYNKMNSSSVVGGRVTTEYWAMKDNANPWLKWLMGTNWGPVIASGTYGPQSMFFHELEDSTGTIISARDVEMSYFWAKITQDNNAHGLKYQLKDWSVMDFGIVRGGEMIGINTPSYVEPKIPAIAQGGFLNSLWASLQQTLQSIAAPLGSVFGWLGNAAFNFADTILGYFGLSGIFHTITGFISNGWTSVSSILTTTLNMIISFVTLIPTYIGFIFYFATNMLSVVVTISSTVIAIFNGTASVTTGVGNIISLLRLNDITVIPFYCVAVLLAWLISLDERSRGSGGKLLKLAIEEAQIFVGLTLGLAEFIFNFFLKIIALIQFLIGLIPGL